MMERNLDTNSVLIHEPMDSGVIRALSRPANRWCIMDEEVTGVKIEYPEDLTFSDISAPVPVGSQETTSFMELLANGAKSFSKEIIFGLACVQIDITRLSSNDLRTAAIDTYAIVNTCREEEAIVVSMSRSLMMSREKVQESSLLAPSGAYLTWMAMLQDDLPEDE